MKRLTAPIVAIFGLVFASPVSAHCPLCTAGVLGGLTLTRWLGVDDIYSGLWFGALIGSLSFWFGGSVKKRYLPYQEYVLFFLAFLLTTVPFLYSGLSNPHVPRILGVNRLFAGMVLGGIVFLLSSCLDKAVRRVNKGHSLFPYQGVIMTLGSVIVAAGVTYLLLR